MVNCGQGSNYLYMFKGGFLSYLDERRNAIIGQCDYTRRLLTLNSVDGFCESLDIA